MKFGMSFICLPLWALEDARFEGFARGVISSPGDVDVVVRYCDVYWKLSYVVNVVKRLFFAINVGRRSARCRSMAVEKVAYCLCPLEAPPIALSLFEAAHPYHASAHYFPSEEIGAG